MQTSTFADEPLFAIITVLAHVILGNIKICLIALLSHMMETT